MAASPFVVRFRIVLWTLVVLCAVGATLLFFLRPPAVPAGVTGTAFSMQSTKGGSFGNADLKGTPTLVFFGYTFCPDICPTTLAEISALKTQLGLKPGQLRTVFVTVDPARDKPDVLASYLASFDPEIIGLYGDDTQTTAAKASFGAQSELGTPDKDGNYLVNHTATVFVMDRDGNLSSLIDLQDTQAAALGKIKRAVES